jgi:AraC-like DNA-binding protein
VRILAILAVALAAGLAAALPANGHDSHAPPGAPHRWLPDEEWVMDHWVPFDESRLHDLLGIRTERLFTWLLNDHRTLGDLARRRGVDPDTLARRLIAPYKDRLSKHQYAIRLARSDDMVTQGHLAQHVFFHVFHGDLLTGHFQSWFGVSHERWRELRLDRWSPRRIAREGGRDPQVVARHVVGWYAMMADDGVDRHATSRAEADYMLARQVRLTNCWMKSPLPRYDRKDPFGRRWDGHGPHDADSRIGVIHPKPPKGCWKKLMAG